MDEVLEALLQEKERVRERESESQRERAQRWQGNRQEDGDADRGREILQVFVSLGMLLGFLLSVRGSH